VVKFARGTILGCGRRCTKWVVLIRYDLCILFREYLVLCMLKIFVPFTALWLCSCGCLMLALSKESIRVVIFSIGRESCSPWWLSICFAKILVRSVDGVSCFSSYDVCICLCVSLVMFIDANRKHFNIQWENRSWNNWMRIDCHRHFDLLLSTHKQNAWVYNP
jgi:hypothetical protein